MKRKLTSSEANNPEGGYGQSSVDKQAQPSGSLELEQSAVSVDAGGFILDSHLAQSLGMRPGDRIFRSMFYGTSQAPLVSGLAAQLLEEHEALISRASGEGTSSAVQLSDRDSALMASNEMTIRALLDSVEASRFSGIEAPLQVVPAEVVEENTACWQAPGTVETAGASTYWQAPGAVETAGASTHWQAPGAVETAGASTYWQAPGAVETAGASTHWQAPGAVETAGASTYWQAPGAVETAGANTYWQAPGAVETAGASTYWQAPGAVETAGASTHWQAPGAVETAGASTYWQAPGAVETAGANAYWQAPGAVETAGANAYWQAPGAVETAGASAYWQAPGAVETAGASAQSARGHEKGVISAKDVALELGMRPGQALRRSMFYNTPQYDTVLNIINRLSVIREGLLRNLELERAGLIQEEIREEVGYKDTTVLIRSNAALMQSLIGSIETPTAVIKEQEKKEKQRKREEEAVKRRENLLAKEREREEKLLAKEQEKKERLIKKEEEAAAKRREKMLAKEQEKKDKPSDKGEEEAKKKRRKVKLVTKEQEKTEKLRRKEEEEETKDREREVEVAIRIAICRKAELERVKGEVEESVKELEVTASSSSGEKDAENKLGIIKAIRREIGKVIAGPRSKDLQEIEKELNRMVSRYEELKRAGADSIILMGQIRTKETRARKDLKKTIERETKVKDLEQELGILVAKELDLEKTGTNKEELDEVRKREIKVEIDLAELRAMIAVPGGSIEIELELGRLVAERTAIEAGIDIGKKKMELNRLRKEAGAQSSEKELELMLRLEEINTKVRVIELELELWLGKYGQDPSAPTA
ncbi:hypothetical protein [Candidatus Ichthyocystis sparus]|uniref:hypothetical protein n=1 Tax=Candidatus Ichthyocystis sparus TaxID=1561004 RepID=UPI000AC35E35|nr:hypothetical protein [Candidatus Ichthyocystis sparus]